VATWSSTVVPTGMPLRGPDMSVDVGLCAVSEETAGSDGSDPLAVGLSDPLGLCGAVGAATTAAYVAPPSVPPAGLWDVPTIESWCRYVVSSQTGQCMRWYS